MAEIEAIEDETVQQGSESLQCATGVVRDHSSPLEQLCDLVKDPSLLTKTRICHSDSVGLTFNDGIRKIDYLLAYEVVSSDVADKDWTQPRAAKRQAFLNGLRARGIEVEEADNAHHGARFIKLHVPFDVCLHWAEEMDMRLPIAEEDTRVTVLGARARGMARCCHFFQHGIEPMADCYSAKFVRARLEKFLNHDKPDKFLTNAQRSCICHYIMTRTAYGDANPTKIGIDRLLGNTSFVAAYPLHEGNLESDAVCNTRKVLYSVWGCFSCWYKLQPLDHMRLYFGEQISMYFAWLGY
eukprot:scpid91191/ scgid10958/ Anoctamin-4; Transmembrane protein 16D